MGHLTGMDKVDYSALTNRVGAAGAADHRSVTTADSAATVHGPERRVLTETSGL
jgi:hypothetical protein